MEAFRWRGYRPFFLLAVVLAALEMPLWLAIHAGEVDTPPYLAPASWHAHEMLFGYLVAVLAGFLLIGTRGWRVALLVSLWLSGRIAMIAPDLAPAWVVAAADLAFLPALALLRTPPLWRAMKWPMALLPALLTAFALANLLFHFEALGIMQDGAARGRQLALDLAILMMVVMAGRLVPGYTRALGIPVRRPRDPLLERASVGVGIGLLLLDLCDIPSGASVAALLLALLQVMRFRGWRTPDTLSIPLLWILHAGYAWLILALLLRGMAEFTVWIGRTEAIHALTVGAIGCLTLGMMSRLIRVHGRRPLTVGRLMVASYSFVLAAAVLRTFGPALAPSITPMSLWIAGALWSLAFALFLVGDRRLWLQREGAAPGAP